jgi:MFS family permease
VSPLRSAWQTLRALPATVWLIGLISFVNDSASDLIYPLLPLYLSSVLMAGPRALGIIEGIAEATASLLKLFSGVMVDRTRRSKPWIVVGYALAGFSRPLIAFTTHWSWLAFLRFSDRVGKGLRSSPRDALLANSVDASRRGLVFGLHRAMDNAGAVVGPLLAALLLTQQVPLRDIFYWSTVPAVLCLLLTLALREPAIAAKPFATPAFDWRLRNLPSSLRRYLLVIALFTLGNSSNLFLLLRAQELGVPQPQVPLLWALVSLVASIFSTPLAALSDRFGRVRLIVTGYLTYGFCYATLALFPAQVPLPAVYGLFALMGLFMAATEGVEKALVADLAPVEQRGTAFGWFNLTAGVMLLPASVIFGFLYQQAGAMAAFGFSAACALGAACALWRWARNPAIH